MPPQHFPPNDHHDYHHDRQPIGPVLRFFVALAIVLPILLGVWFFLAATSRSTPIESSPPPIVSTDDAEVVEQRLQLGDGRVLTCLTFSTPFQPVSCDWGRAYAP